MAPVATNPTPPYIHTSYKMASTLRPGRLLLTLSAIGHILGAPIADFNETHVLNPNWPPHARFHNGQTMSLSVSLGLLILYYTWRSPRTSSSSVPASPRAKEDDMLTAAVVGSLYFGSGLTAILYPGSSGIDPEFRHTASSDFPQFWLFVGFLVTTWAGWAVERWGVGTGGKGRKGE